MGTTGRRRSRQREASRARDRKHERGAAIVEYMVLMGTTGVMSLIMLTKLGALISVELDVARAALRAEEAAQTIGNCPTGWNLIADIQTKKNGQSVDANGDGLICRKDIPGEGNGNTNQNANVKDNNGS